MKKIILYSLLISLVFCTSISQISVLKAQTETMQPILFTTDHELISWTEVDGYVSIATLPEPSYDTTGRRRHILRRDIVASPDLRYIAYAVTTPEWQTRIGNDEYYQGDQIGKDIFLVDVSTGETRQIARQTASAVHYQVLRWSLAWLNDEQLIWLENAFRGDAMIYDVSTEEITLFAEEVSTTGNTFITAYTNDIIVVNISGQDIERNGYTVYDEMGSQQHYTPVLNSTDDYLFTFFFWDNEIPYIGTNAERMNLNTGGISTLPSGRLLLLSRTSPENSIRITPARSNDGLCTVDFLSPEGELITTIEVFGNFHFSPDGRAVLQFIYGSQRGVIHQFDQDNNVRQIELPTYETPLFLLGWGTQTAIYEHTNENNNWYFACAIG